MIHKPIFITGATGLLGSHVLEQLINHGYQDIRILVRRMAQATHLPNSLKVIEGNILNVPLLSEALRGVHTIIHCAAMVSYDTSREEELMKVNKEGTANIVNCALLNNCKKLVHISSIAALGKNKNGAAIDENSKWDQYSSLNTVYAKSKYQSEMEAWRGYYEGLAVTVLCPSVILGTGDYSKSSLQLVEKIHSQSRFYPIGSTGFVDVKDVAIAVVKSLDSTHDGKKYIISAENMSYKDFFEHIALQLKVSPPTIVLNSFIGKLAVMIESIRSKILNTSPLLTSETLRSTSFSAMYENARSINELGLKYTNIRDSISSMVEKYLYTIKKSQ